MRRALLALGGALLVVAMALFYLPARLLPLVIDQQNLRLSGVSGTLLEGRAARAMLSTPAGFLHLGELQWQLRPLSLLRLRPRARLSSEWGGQRASFELTVSGERLVLRDVDITVNAALAKQMVPVELDGRIGLLFDELTLSANALHSAQGRVVWQSAAWRSPGGVRMLGSYVASVSSGADQVINAEIDTMSGPVRAEGVLSLERQRYAIDLRIRGDGPPLAPELAQALSLIASPVENGYRLRLDGEL